MPTYSYTNGTVNTQGTEKDFISTFIKQMMHETAFSSLHTLECKIGTTMGGSPYTVSLTEVTTDTEVDNQISSVFSSSSSSNKPTFSFKIDDCATLLFTRYNTWSTQTVQPYQVSADFFGTSVSDKDDQLDFTSGNFTGNRYRYQIVWNANIIYVVFGLYNEDFPLTVRRAGQTKDRNYQAFCYKKNSDKICGLHAGETLYDNSNRGLNLKNRIGYVNNSANPTDIETIQNKAVLCNSDKILVAENIWDSSSNGVLMLPVNVIVNNQNHTGVYLNNYTVVPLLELE